MGVCCSQISCQTYNYQTNVTQMQLLQKKDEDFASQCDEIIIEDISDLKNEKAVIIQSHYRAYKARQNIKKQSSLLAIENNRPKKKSEQDSTKDCRDSKNSISASLYLDKRSINPQPSILFKHQKNPSQESYRPRGTHLPDYSVATRLTKTLADYPLLVQQTILKLGLFPFKEYLLRPKSVFYNASSDDNSLPFLEAYLMENGNIYVGQWKQGKRHGKGKYIWIDGSIYEGFWKNDQPCGMGRLIYFNGNSYLGDWNMGQCNGEGQLLHADGSIQKGMWQDNHQHGYGEEQWNDGTIYKGMYEDGGKCGFGKYLWADESTYEGYFYNNMFEGQGIYRWLDGREVLNIPYQQYQGKWKYNKMHGKGIFIWPDGRRYEGEYVNDLKEGNGQFTFADGKIYSGEWYEGKMHGDGQMSQPNGQIKYGTWIKGKLV